MKPWRDSSSWPGRTLTRLSVGWPRLVAMNVEGVLRRQAGVIARRQALALGVSGSAIADRVAAGVWRPLHPGVYLARSHRWAAEAMVWAAVLWAGVGATLSGPAAAWWHGLLVEPAGPIDVTVPRRRYLQPRPNIQVRRRDLPAEDRIQRRGVWVTSVALTVLEAATALGADGALLLDRALQRSVGFDEVYRAHCRNLGRHGSRGAGALLAAAADRAASQAERRMIKLLRGAGLTGWVTGYRTGGFVLDFAFPTLRIAIEVDGWAWHWDAERFRHDRRRQNAVTLADWTILRYTWHDLVQRPADVLAQIRAALAAARARAVR